MSGGSYNYLCYCQTCDFFSTSKIETLKTMKQDLIEEGYKDIAEDVDKLIECIVSAKDVVETLSEQLHDVFHDMEWYASADIGQHELHKTLDKYRRGNKHEVQKG